MFCRVWLILFPPVVVSHLVRVELNLILHRHQDCIPRAVMQYVDFDHQITELYPNNPNGSEKGITALSSDDGRVTDYDALTCERIFRRSHTHGHRMTGVLKSPWMQMFRNARIWCN